MRNRRIQQAAFGMQQEVPVALDISQKSKHSLDAYGLASAQTIDFG